MKGAHGGDESDCAVGLALGASPVPEGGEGAEDFDGGVGDCRAGGGGGGRGFAGLGGRGGAEVAGRHCGGGCEESWWELAKAGEESGDY